MAPDAFEDAEPDTLGEAEAWDEETLGLDWNEADTQSVVREVVPAHAPD